MNCSAVNCSGESLYYSRRIGRTPELAGIYGDTVPLQPTTILGAAKLIGRFPSGTTVGLLDASTQRAASPGDTTYDPGTNFAVLRATQDFRGGNSAIGAMLTAVNRRLDQWSSPYLAVQRVRRLRWISVTGSSRTTTKSPAPSTRARFAGSQAVISSLQNNAVHYYQRPDANLPLDSTRDLTGRRRRGGQFGKIGGGFLLFETAYSATLARASRSTISAIFAARTSNRGTPGPASSTARQRFFYNRFQLNNNWWQYWTTDGLPLEARTTPTPISPSRTTGLAHGRHVGQLGTTYDDRTARGGPAVRQDPYVAPWLSINGDDRKAIVPYCQCQLLRELGERSHSWNVSPEIDYQDDSGRFSSALSLGWTHNVQDNQWYGNFNDAAGTHYTFAHLDQHTTSVTARLNYTFTPNVSLQAYASAVRVEGNVHQRATALGDASRRQLR